MILISFNEKFNETTLPGNFYSNLNIEDITNSD